MNIFKPGRFLLNKKLAMFKEYARGQIIDVGSGGKDYRWIFNDHTGYKTLEIDKKFDPDMIGSAYKIPVANNTYDTIVCTQVFEHLDDPKIALVEFHRVLKYGGHVILSAPFFNELHEEPMDYLRFTKYYFKNIAEKIGLQMIKVEPVGGYYALKAQITIKYWWERWKDNKILLNILYFWSRLYGRFMLYLDNLDKSKAKEKYTINLIVILKK